MQNEFFGRKNEVENGFSGIAEEVEGFRQAEIKSEEKIKDIISSNANENAMEVAHVGVFGENNNIEVSNGNDINIDRDTKEPEIYDAVMNVIEKTKDNPFELNEKIEQMSRKMRGK